MNPALADLRDIHLPAAPGWWPPAPGWWLLAILVLILLGLAGWYGARLAARRRYRRQARNELAVLAAATPAPELPLRINALLKRVALAAYPDQAVAGLHGERWVRFLAQHAPLPVEDANALAVLADDLYRPTARTADEDLLRAAERWIRRHR